MVPWLANGDALGSNSYPYGEPVLGLTLPIRYSKSAIRLASALGLMTAVWVSELCRIRKQES
jgi:hypothetical protein